MNKKEQLTAIADQISQCKLCRYETIGKPVPGEGNPDAKIVFVGEAPGKQESKTGSPFIGKSGKLLRKEIQNIGLLEEDVFITSVCKYLPVKGTPTAQQIAHGRTHLEDQLALIDPTVVVLLGSVACKGVLELPISIAKEHGKVIQKNGKKYFISYHPAAAIRFKKNLALFIEDFKSLKAVIAAV